MALDNLLNRTNNLYNFDARTSVPDLSRKVIIVTGGNVGLGYQSIVQLVPHKPAKIYLTARSQAKYDAALESLRKDLPSTDLSMLSFVQMDLASLQSVKRAADHILAQTERIDILMNNAGIMGAAPALTQEGYETHFGTNHMGHALFTKLLIPTLLRTAKTSEVRIVNVSSGAFEMADAKTGYIDEQLVKSDMSQFSGSNGNMLSRYGLSKLANVLHARALAKHYPSITSVAIAPGRVKTGLLDNMYKQGNERFYGYFQKFYDVVVGAKSPYDGALCQVWAAVEPNKDRLENGAMYFPIGTKSAGTKLSNDEKNVDRLWEFQEAEFQRLGY